MRYVDERESWEAGALENDGKEEGRKKERKEGASKTAEFHLDWWK